MDKGFKVVTRDSSASHEWLKMAAEGSPMQKYYQDYMHDNPGTKFNRDPPAEMLLFVTKIASDFTSTHSEYLCKQRREQGSSD